MATIHTTDMPISGDHIGSGHSSALFSFVTSIGAHWRKWRIEQARAAEFARLDDTILRDIGLEQDEIWLTRRGVQFTPRSWR